MKETIKLHWSSRRSIMLTIRKETNELQEERHTNERMTEVERE